MEPTPNLVGQAAGCAPPVGGFDARRARRSSHDSDVGGQARAIAVIAATVRRRRLDAGRQRAHRGRLECFNQTLDGPELLSGAGVFFQNESLRHHR